MSNFFKFKSLTGSLRVPGDKSVSHRAIMLSSLASGRVKIENLLESGDVKSTMDIFRACGISIEKKGEVYTVTGKGLYGLNEPEKILDVGNSGTTMRLMSGILGAQKFTSILTGDSSILIRPVRRVILPLRQMRIRIHARREDQVPPVVLLPCPGVSGIRYTLPLPSAQLKSALLFAGLYAQSSVVIREKIPSRDHTENLFSYFHIPIKKEKDLIILDNRRKEFRGRDILVPGDFSSAAFFIVGALIARNSRVTLNDIGLNPTRTGLLEVLKRMGARITVSGLRRRNNEIIGTVTASSSELKGTEILPKEIPSLIDEIPILSIAALKAQGMTVLKGAKELRVKESDRIRSIVENLKVLGANVKELDDGFVINGGNLPLQSGKQIRTYRDHRIAMSFIVASLLVKNGVRIEEIESIGTSFPGFIDQMRKANS